MVNRLAILLALLPGIALAQTPARVGPLNINNNLAEILANGPGAQTAAQTNLGLGSMATQGAGAVAIAGGTIAGLGSLGVTGPATVGGTLSGAGVTAMLAPYAPLASPTFSGTVGGAGLAFTGNGTVGGTLGVTGALTGAAGTFSGNLGATNGTLTTGSNTAVNSFLFANGVGGQRGIRFQSAGVDRWRLFTGTGESGNTTGSDLFLQNDSDVGVPLGTLLTITRATGFLNYTAAGLFHYISTKDNDPVAGFVGWNNQKAGRGGRIGLTGQADNNGYVYTPVPAWVAGTPYVVGSSVVVGPNIMNATTAGTSGTTPPPCNTFGVTTCSDGVVSWAFESTIGGDRYQEVGGFMSGTMAASFGGTAAGPVGTVFGFNTQANINVPFGKSVIGYENNFGLAFPAYARVGEQIVGGVGGTNQGSQDDVGWRISSQGLLGGGGSAPLRDLMNWGTRTQGILLDPNGYGLRAWSAGWNQGGGPSMMVGAGAIDMTEFQPTGVGRFGGGFILRGPGSQILGSGDIQSNSALIHATATGGSLDVSQYRVSAITVHPGAAGTTWGASGWLADCTDGSVIKITSVAGGAVTGASLFYAAFASAPIATVTCVSEQFVGGNDTAGNPLLPDSIQIDETWTLANAGAPVLALGGTASVQISPSGGPTTVGGTLGVTGPATFAGTLGVTGAVTLAGTLQAGTTTLFSANGSGLLTLGAGGASNHLVIAAPLAGTPPSIVATGSNGFVLNAGTGAVTSTSPFAVNPSTITWSGIIKSPAFSSTQVHNGAATSIPALNALLITDSVSAPGIVTYGLGINHTYGGGTTAGGRFGLNVNLVQQGGANADTGADNYYTGATIQAFARFSQPGSSPTTPKGRIFGFNSVGQVQGGFVATNLFQVAAAEFDVGLSTGSTASTRSGVTVADLGGTAQGFNVDNMLWLYGAGMPWRYGTMYGDSQPWPMDATLGTMFGANIGASGYAGRPYQTKWGIDLEQVMFPSSGNPYDGGPLRSKGFAIDGNGTVQQGSCYTSAGASGQTIDCKGSVGTGATIATAGSGYSSAGVSAEAVTALGGVWLVTTDGTGTPISVAVLVQPQFASNTPPANPITPVNLNRASLGTGLTINIAWNTTANSLAVQPTAGGKVGFFGATPVTKQTGVAVTAAAIFTALQNLGLISP